MLSLIVLALVSSCSALGSEHAPAVKGRSPTSLLGRLGQCFASELSQQVMAPSVEFKLPSLPYSYDTLEPHISSQIMTLHHSKHHQAYVTNLNAALSSQVQALDSSDIRTQLGLQAAIKFNAGGHINHSLFWENLAPASSGLSKAEGKAPSLTKALTTTYGGIAEFKAKFEKLLLSIQGSGWGWLVIDADNKALEILQTKDQDTVPAGKKPLLGIDMWEHAYYLQYLNGKAAYVKAVWEVVNWETVEKRYVEADWWNTWQPLLSRL